MTAAQPPGVDRSRAWRMTLALLSMLAAAAQAGEPGIAAPVRLDIPAQPLDTALAAYTNATGLSALVASDLTAGRRAAAVHGVYPPHLALLKLLADTDLQVRYVGPTAFTLTAPASSAVAGMPERADADAALRAYAGVVQATLTRSLCHWQGADFGRYRVGLQLWIARSGAVSRVRLLGSTGQPERDTVLPQRLRGLLMDAPPPAGLAQPLTLLLTPRADAAAQCRAAGAVQP